MSKSARGKLFTWRFKFLTIITFIISMFNSWSWPSKRKNETTTIINVGAIKLDLIFNSLYEIICATFAVEVVHQTFSFLVTKMAQHLVLRCFPLDLSVDRLPLLFFWMDYRIFKCPTLDYMYLDFSAIFLNHLISSS